MGAHRPARQQQERAQRRVAEAEAGRGPQDLGRGVEEVQRQTGGQVAVHPPPVPVLVPLRVLAPRQRVRTLPNTYWSRSPSRVLIPGYRGGPHHGRDHRHSDRQRVSSDGRHRVDISDQTAEEQDQRRCRAANVSSGPATTAAATASKRSLRPRE